MNINEQFAAMNAALSPKHLIDGLRALGFVMCEEWGDGEIRVVLDGTLYLKGEQAAYWRKLMELAGEVVER